MRFYDREKELNYLKTYVQLEPNSILFVYGPKSSGKTTVMLRVIEELSNNDDLVFFYYDLRRYATPTKEEFLNIFFEKGDKKYLLNKLEINLKIFKFGVEEKFDFNNIKLNDVFDRIYEGIEAVIKDNKKPVLVIDELQKLKNIYFNEGKSLLNELFNLFVHLTKVRHFCHVICLTSDTLFIEEIYKNSTLKNASEYYLIDWLSKETIKNILKEEGFSEEEISYCLNYLSLPYEISQLINNKKLGLSDEETIKKWVNVEADGLRFLIANMPDDLDENKIYEILIKFRDKIKVNDYEIIKRELIKEFKFLVENEILFYDVINGIIKPTSIIEWHAIKEILDNR
ncbi:ATP-binding protein [Methanocaldococcus fervens]|uniref:ATPase n=1 Tax=Methanocaldococcus fervens (strain DSM 4213 / JCM 15782 / AG86) TaxID=573064 RepID=C7P6Z7_METFA|nr:ATP-binding protein [Methanocaldococcus fervens]ACV24329.1 ATPase [Methanocaldococcus fervens AG86]